MKSFFIFIALLLPSVGASAYECVKKPWFLGEAWLFFWSATEMPGQVVWSDNDSSFAGYYESYEHRKYISSGPPSRRRVCLQLFIEDPNTGDRAMVGDYFPFTTTEQVYWMAKEQYLLVGGWDGHRDGKSWYKVALDGSRKLIFQANYPYLSQMIPSPDGKTLAFYQDHYGTDDGSEPNEALVILFEAQSGEEIHRWTLDGPERWRQYTWHPDGYFLVTLDGSRAVAIDPKGGIHDVDVQDCFGPQTTSSEVSGDQREVGFDDDGRTLVITDSDKDVFGCL